MGVTDKPKAALSEARHKAPWLDHLIRAYKRYSGHGGGRLAASVTLPGFLSFFPLLALAFFVLGTVLAGNTGAQNSVLDSAHSYLGNLLCSSADGVKAAYHCGTGNSSIDISSIKPKSGSGITSLVIGVVGLVLAGTGWVNNLRSALRELWDQDQRAGNFLGKKLSDLLVLVVLGGTLLASVGVAGLATSATSTILGWVDLDGNVLANIVVKIVGVGVSIAVNVSIFVFLFTRLDIGRSPWRTVLRGSVLAGCLFEVLQIFGATYIAHTTSNPVYGIFAAVIGLIIWIGVVVQITLFSAAWTGTGPYADAVAPATLPEPAPPAYPEGPSVGPLVGSTRGKRAPRADAPGANAARAAGVGSMGLLVAGAAGVAVYGIKTIRDTFRE